MARRRNSDSAGAGTRATESQEVKRLRAELNEEKTARLALEHALLEASSREQARLAQTLHDTVCQSFSGIYLMARIVLRKLQRVNPDAARDVEELGDVIHKAVGELHDLTTWLRPAKSGEMDLGTSLAELVRTASQKVRCRLEIQNGAAAGDRFTAVQFFQIAHEAVSNAIYQSGAREVLIKVSGDAATVIMSISDDGKHAGKPRSSSAVSGFDLLRHRATVIGATLDISPGEKGGTIITCRLSRTV